MQMEKLQHIADLWAYTIDTSGFDDKRQFWFCVYMDISSFFFCHPSHLSISPVHLPIVLATVFCFFTGELPPCLLKCFQGKLLPQCLPFYSSKSFHLFFRVSGPAGTSFFSGIDSVVPAFGEGRVNFHWSKYVLDNSHSYLIHHYVAPP